MGDIAVWEDENLEVFEDLLARVAEDAEPKGPIEWILVRDYVLAEWRIRRIWRQRDVIERLGRLQAVTEVLQQGCTDPLEALMIDQLAIAWINYEKPKCFEARVILERLRISKEDIYAYASIIMAGKLENISRQESRLYERRNDALHQLESRRFNWAQRVKRRSADVIDANYVEADVPSLPPGAHAVAPS
ncbi:hypothetical protein CCR97_19650 [Rhodoplanes elegans]|nr:hypothetical protein [Rhodoplanes elegans]